MQALLNYLGGLYWKDIACVLQVKIVNFLSSFCPSIPKGQLDTKKTTPNIGVCPDIDKSNVAYYLVSQWKGALNARARWLVLIML